MWGTYKSLERSKESKGNFSKPLHHIKIGVVARKLNQAILNVFDSEIFMFTYVNRHTADYDVDQYPSEKGRSSPSWLIVTNHCKQYTRCEKITFEGTNFEGDDKLPQKRWRG